MFTIYLSVYYVYFIHKNKIFKSIAQFAIKICIKWQTWARKLTMSRKNLRKIDFLHFRNDFSFS